MNHNFLLSNRVQIVQELFFNELGTILESKTKQISEYPNTHGRPCRMTTEKIVTKAIVME